MRSASRQSPLGAARCTTLCSGTKFGAGTKAVRAMAEPDRIIDSPIARDDPEAAAVFPRKIRHVGTARFLLDSNEFSVGMLKFRRLGVSHASVGDICILNRDEQAVLAAVQSSEFPPVVRPA